MKTALSKLAILAAGVLGASAAMADFDGSNPLLCSFGRVIECDDGAECRAVTNASVDAPDFVKLDFGNKQLVEVWAGEDGLQREIGTITKLPNYLVLQSVQGGSNNDTLGWSMSLSYETGQIVVTGSGEAAGFVIFGACMPM